MGFRKVVVVILFLISGFLIKAQDAHFSQFYAAGLYLNPALAGAEPEPTFKSNFRSQWRSATLPYVTSQVSLIKPINGKTGIVKSHIGGLGISFYNDKAGDGNFKTLGIMATGAYNLALSSDGYHYLSFGLQGGFIQKQLDFTNLEWGEQFNPYVGYDPSIAVTESNIIPRSIVPDVNTGLMWYYNGGKNYMYKGISAYSGVAFSHLLRPDESIVRDQVSRLPILYKYHGGVEFHMSPKFNISPNLLFMYQGDVFQLNGGLYISYQMIEKHPNNVVKKAELIAGAWYRYNDSFIFLVGVENDYYTVGFSYDINSSGLRTSTRGRGAYEISLAVRMVTERKLAKFSTPRI